MDDDPIRSPDHESLIDNEAHKRKNICKIISRIPTYKKTILGSSFWGVRVFLCNSRGVNERDDK
jgi:hypothetical protein